MTKYTFKTNLILEATSEEDVVRQVMSRLGSIARHLADGTSLAATEPFFEMAETDRGTPQDVATDPIVMARRVVADEAAKREEKTTSKKTAEDAAE